LEMERTLYFYAYPSAFQNPGGGEILLLMTKRYLERLGISVQLFNLWTDCFKEGDLLHVFGSIKEALGLMEAAKLKGVTIVHSPVIWYNWQSAFSIPYSSKERGRCVLRQLVKTLLPGVPSSRRKMMQLADVVLGASGGEAAQISRYFLIPKSRVKVVTYGADERYEDASRQLFEEKYGLKNFILTVGRIEPRKNQLTLIRAASRLEQDLVIIGNPVSNHMTYYQQCRRAAGPNVHFIGSLHMDSEALSSAYAACEVFVMPSWFETPGLAALEAGLAGAKVVITQGGPTREYFRDYASYVNPASEKDICEKINAAMRDERAMRLRNHIKTRYLWQHVARQTLEIYRSLGYDYKDVQPGGVNR